jgi:hypothetical protein
VRSVARLQDPALDGGLAELGGKPSLEVLQRLVPTADGPPISPENVHPATAHWHGTAAALAVFFAYRLKLPLAAGYVERIHV